LKGENEKKNCADNLRNVRRKKICRRLITISGSLLLLIENTFSKTM
jgi:hypothetical protein